MALFSRRKKSEPTNDAAEPVEEVSSPDLADALPESADAEPAASGPEPVVPEVSISVQSFRGVGAQAGPQVDISAPEAAPASAPVRALPLAPIAPPAQSHTSKAVPDNVLLREALARLGEAPSNEELLGVLRQMLQGHMLLRVHGNVQEQLAAGKGLSIGLLRDGERSFLLAFSSAAAMSRTIEAEGSDPKDSSVIAQPVSEILAQVIANDFTGLVVDNGSAPHRAVFPTDVLKRAIEQADPKMAVKAILAVPQTGPGGAEPLVAEALASTRMWVAAGSQPDGQVGIAEMRGQDGRRYLQLFTHPLEVIAMGRDERPLPFTPEQLGKTLHSNPGITGVLIDPAGPSAVVSRDALAAVIALAGE